MAATFRNTDGLQKILQSREVTIIVGLEPTPQLGKLLTGAVLPEGWTAQSRAPRSTSILVLQLPNNVLSAKELQHNLHCSAPMLLPFPHGEEVPHLLTMEGTGTNLLTLAELNADILIAVLSATHSATGRIDDDAVRAALPDDGKLAALDSAQLAVAFRANTAVSVAERIAILCDTSSSKDHQPEVPRTASIEGMTPAHRAARDIVADLAAWRDDEIAWTEMTRSLLLHGEPGTGKTYLARQMSAAVGLAMVEGSFAFWQAAGHLGQMLAAMKKCFDDAIAQAPCILFIDEIDAVGSRFSGDQQNMSYRTQVVNGFLQQMDRLALNPGVILLGACNQVDQLDPAITRPGRFDQIVRMPFPSLQDIAGILKKGALVELAEKDILQVAREAVGKTPAQLDAAIRAAKGDSRRRNVALDAALLRRHLGLDRFDPDLLHRISVHEAGHALVASILAPGAVIKVTVSEKSGLTERKTALRQITVQEIDDELLILMSGRAAERLVLGTISGGAGGDTRSDIAQASKLVLQMDRELGLGKNGDGWLGPAHMHKLGEDEKQRIRVKLGQAERRAQAILKPNKDTLQKIAQELMVRREMYAAELAPLLLKSASSQVSLPPSGTG